MVIAGPSPWSGRRASMSGAPRGGALAVMVSGGRKPGSMGQARLSQGGTSAGISAGRGAYCPGGTVTRPVYAAQGGPRAAAVRPDPRRRGCDQGRRACPSGVGQAQVRTGTAAAPPLPCGARQRLRRGPGLHDGPGTAEAADPCCSWGCRHAIPSPSARHGPLPRGVADGDGMTRPAERCAYAAPRKNHPAGTCKAQENGDRNDRADRRKQLESLERIHI